MATFRFIVPLPEHNIYQITIEAKNLDDAFAEYAANWWQPDNNAAVAVWLDCYLVAQVLPIYSNSARGLKPVLEEILRPLD